MSLIQISGQSLVDDLITNLGGFAAAFNASELLTFVNAGVQEAWSVLKSADEDYFIVPSQASDSTLDTYFPALTTSSREFTLPNGCRELRFIECVTAGFEDLQFEFRRISDPEFQQERRLATESGAGSGRQQHARYLYTIIGNNTIQFASYLEAAVTLKLWFVAAIDDLDIDNTLSSILHPFAKKIVTYATERATLSLQEEQLSDKWLRRWRADVVSLMASATQRDTTGAEFVIDWEGE